MTILACTVYAGSEALVAMTERMLEQFTVCTAFVSDPVRIVAFNNGAERPIKKGLVTWHAHSKENIGFGKAVNALIESELYTAQKVEGPHDITHVLVLNNDLEFPDPNWLHALLAEREGNLVLSPTTDRTATKEAVADFPVVGGSRSWPIRVGQCSAFCWLVPLGVIRSLRKRFGFNLFDPDFFAYGEDDYTGAILRRHLDPKPFKVVVRSWVRHLKGKTGSEMKLGGGMPKNLEMLRRKMRQNGLR